MRGTGTGDGAAATFPFAHAIVCTGGGNLGAAQVGMLRVLLGAGVVPDLLVGCSVGALNAAFMAVDPTPSRVDDLDALWRSLSGSDVFRGTRRTVAANLLRRCDHLYSSEGLRDLIRRAVPLGDLADSRVPVHVVTTDLGRGEAAWWSDGDPVEVLTASASLPGVFAPVRLGDGPHVDGGVLCAVPVGRALELGARTVWVLYVSSSRTVGLPDNPSALDVLLASFATARRALLEDGERLRQPGQQVVTIAVETPDGLDVRDFSATPGLIAAGADAARGVLAAMSAEAAAG